MPWALSSLSLYSTFGLVFFPEDGGNRFFGNVDNDQPDHKASVIFIVTAMIISNFT
jgi:hypothetical protein